MRLHFKRAVPFGVAPKPDLPCGAVHCGVRLCGALEGRSRRTVAHGQLVAANDASRVEADLGFDGVAAAVSARVKARPVVTVPPVALGQGDLKGDIPALTRQCFRSMSSKWFVRLWFMMSVICRPV